MLTDPSFHTKGNVDGQFGDLGDDGINVFWSKHDCNDICTVLSLERKI
jgi:hypothetical protein